MLLKMDPFHVENLKDSNFAYGNKDFVLATVQYAKDANAYNLSLASTFDN